MEISESQVKNGKLRILRVLLTACFVLGALAFFARLLPLLGDELRVDDFTPDYVSSKAWVQGEDPYADLNSLAKRFTPEAPQSPWPDGQRNPHPPLHVALFALVSWLPYKAARIAWLVVMSSLMVTGIYLVLRRFAVRRVHAIAGGIVTLSLPIAQLDLSYGQIGGLSVFIIAFAWRAPGDRASPAAGAALGVLTALKFFPALLAIPLLRKRQFRALGGQVATAIVLTVVGGAALGADSFDTWLTQASPDNFKHWAPSPANISLTGFPLRWLTENLWHPGAPDQPVLAFGVVGALIVAGCLCVLVTPARRSGDVFLAALPWMILIAPLSGTLSLVLVIPALIAMVIRSLETHRRAAVTLFFAVAILGVGGLPWLPTYGPNMSTIAILAGYAIPTYALLLLVILDWRRSTAHSVPDRDGFATAPSSP